MNSAKRRRIPLLAEDKVFNLSVGTQNYATVISKIERIVRPWDYPGIKARLRRASITAVHRQNVCRYYPNYAGAEDPFN